jgi:hypothetical protein
VFKQYRTQGRSEFFASVSVQFLKAQTELLVGTGAKLLSERRGNGMNGMNRAFVFLRHQE